jgi:hypothetical protein
MFVLIILGFTANAEQKKSEIRKLDFLKLKKAAMANGINSSQFKQLFIAENQLSVPGFSEDYSWDEDLNDWLHDSNTTYTYNNAGKLTEEIARMPETDIYLTRSSYNDLNYISYEVSYVWGVDEWLTVAGERSAYTVSAESQINGVIEQTIENGIWVNKTRIEYILDQCNIPTQLLTYHWDGNDWNLYSRTGLLTWADWPNRELAAYTLQYMQENNWVNAERYSTQYDGDNYTATTEIWDNEQWVNSTRETYSRTETKEEIIVENWTAQGWEKTEKYQGTFDYYGNPTGMYYSSWYGTDWGLEMELFFDLKYNESNDVTEMVFRYRDPELSEPVNMSKSVYSNFLHFTTDVPEISVLNNVKVFPNPVKNALNISISDADIKSFRVNITNLAGQTVYQDTFSNSSVAINTENLIRGMYVLSIKTEDGETHQTKVFKQ